ncbi:hypothetical protein PHLH8_20730 [Pseudomonas sp. Pc102]|uniref:hypothetical protein n=1 Tax=Pseudomonas sp. Pc102 TaxID=2678261 RepID=UPI001BCADC52|nr:hypothetical protein [Pseudomonas sp. Pc102]BBP82431.1 hypothetical protein PHLH8_20730 [Pseudomonas sp. Pc102]
MNTKRLIEALEPFATECDAWADSNPESMEIWTGTGPEDVSKSALALHDLRELRHIYYQLIREQEHAA